MATNPLTPTPQIDPFLTRDIASGWSIAVDAGLTAAAAAVASRVEKTSPTILQSTLYKTTRVGLSTVRPSMLNGRPLT